VFFESCEQAHLFAGVLQMTAVEEPEPIIETALPEAPQKRDLLGNACFYLHFAVMIYIVIGWLAPWQPLLYFYDVFVPLVVVSWRLNKDSCLLNNLESYIRTGSWRHASNPEEGNWLRTLARNALNLDVTPRQMDTFLYAVMALLWLLGLGHLFFWLYGAASVQQFWHSPP